MRKVFLGGQKRDSSTLEETPDVPLNNTAFGYTGRIGVGKPPTFCEPYQFLPRIVSYIPILDDLIIDTGSSNTWVGANKSYIPTITSVKTSDTLVSIVSRADSWHSSN